ncbi:Tannase [Zalerion maritima]|uniref:Tannase n=1 Tax=Zalerion maritima TaxID=339359 RepID=A0AAD5WQB8_9PEZI|nr:Tannase [Zalerion maritima]
MASSAERNANTHPPPLLSPTTQYSSSTVSNTGLDPKSLRLTISARRATRPSPDFAPCDDAWPRLFFFTCLIPGPASHSTHRVSRARSEGVEYAIHETAEELVDSRVHMTPRALLVVVNYYRDGWAAVGSSVLGIGIGIGGEQTSEAGERIGTAIYLLWLSTVVLLSNTLSGLRHSSNVLVHHGVPPLPPPVGFSSSPVGWCWSALVVLNPADEMDGYLEVHGLHTGGERQEV